MSDGASRVRLEFSSMEDEERFLEWWEATTHASAYADTPSGEGPVTSFYFADKASAEALAAAMRQELSQLSIVPPTIGVHQWRPDELRWDDEPRVDDDGAEAELQRGGSNWFEGLIDGLIRSPWP